MKVLDNMTGEIHEYIFGVTHLDESIPYSEYKLKRRIQMFKNKYYPTGKITPDGDYEFWFDIIHPAVNSEVKNIDFDTKHFLIFSKAPIEDFAAVYVINLSIDEFMWQNGTAEELNESVEDYSADGNLLFEKTADGYERCDMQNTFIVNQTARTVDDTDIIKRFYMTQAELRGMSGVYKNVNDVIDKCGNTFFSRTEKGIGEIRTKKLYEIYRRDGEISERELFEAQGKKGGDANKYILCRIIAAGLKKGKSSNCFILFAEKMDGKMSDYYIESHRGPYKGKWWREGLYELGFDYQIRYNDISNQIARGLEWASKIIFRHKDKQTLQNLRTQLKNGSMIKSEDIQQIAVSIQGFAELVNDRNAILQQWNDLSNSLEVVQGKNLPSQTAFRTAAQMDVNATKLYVFLRQKLALSYRKVFAEFVMPDMVMTMTSKDIIRVTGDPMFLDRFRKMAVDAWYIENLVDLGPHTNEMAQFIKDTKFDEFKQSDPVIENVKEIWKNVLPRLQVTIVGENYLIEQIQDISELISYEQDPIRRAYLLDLIYAAKGIPVPPAVSMEALQNSSGQPLQTEKKGSFAVPKKEEEPVKA
jgi:hypothetical protein